QAVIRELMTQYGKLDILWYDVDWPLTPQQWESEKMNKMVFELQPDIIVNNRNGLPGDFSTPEQYIGSEKVGRAWETCMTMNDSWGYAKSDDAWKSPKTIVRNLIACAKGGGNYLLNIGPKPDGSIPEESVQILTEVGKWMEKNGSAIYATQRCQADWHTYLDYSRKGNTLFVHVYFWPGDTPAQQWLEFFQPPTVVAIGGLRAKVKSARMLATGQPLQFTQDEVSVRFTGLPAIAPDQPATVLALECESEPKVDHTYVRIHRPRRGLGV
ncbi:MAG: alpha-L-fucosidase, partial [Acidobacteriia bacterium]|nr:alpha-L-fucosidase [Terriglobia bacterium]